MVSKDRESQILYALYRQAALIDKNFRKKLENEVKSVGIILSTYITDFDTMTIIFDKMEDMDANIHVTINGNDGYRGLFFSEDTAISIYERYFGRLKLEPWIKPFMINHIKKMIELYKIFKSTYYKSVLAAYIDYRHLDPTPEEIEEFSSKAAKIIEGIGK